MKTEKTIWYDSPYKTVKDKVLYEKYHTLNSDSEQGYREQSNILKELGDRYLKKLDKKFKLK